MSTNRSPLRWYAITAIAVGVAVLVNLALGAWTHPNVFPPFLIAILFCSRYGGMGPGLTATALSLAACTILLVEEVGRPLAPFAIIDRLVTFTGVELLIVYLIVARRKADEALRESEASHRAMFELASVGWVQVDPQTGRFLRVNRRFCEITGYSRNELLARTIRDITYPEDFERDREREDRYSRGEDQEFVTEKRYLRKDGGLVWIYGNATLILDADGRPLRSVGVVQDITERKQAEDQLRMLSRAVEQSPASIIITDTVGAIEYVNPKFTAFTGYTFEEVRGKNPRILKSGETSQEEYQQLWQTIKAGSEWRGEFHNKKKNGELYWESALISPFFDDRGAITHFVAWKEDITDRKRAEEALLAATRAKDRFLAILSHELRTPLTPVLMAVTAMLDSSKRCVSCAPTLEIIRDNIELESRLIDDLLDISRITQGKMTYRFEVVDVHVLIRRTVEICRDEIGLKGHHLAIELEAAEHYVCGDPARLQQVLWNLLTNAVRYTPEGGRIAVRTRSGGTPLAGSGQDHLVVEVSDNGMGIKPEDLSHLFDAFVRVGGAVGLGLGLAISRSIAEAHGGTLKGASAGRRKGATFTLELATVPAPAEPAEPLAAPPAASGRRLRVLFAEDNPVAVRMIAEILHKSGFEITTATCLRQALEVASADFDVVISDIDLGDGSGLELMRHIRSQAHIPGIALSGYATEDDVRQSQEAGFTVHLAKPVTFAKLMSAINQLTVGGCQGDPAASVS